MAISAGMTWEVRNGGGDANGGGFRGGAAVAAPPAPTVAATAGGAVAVSTYFVVVTISDGNGETPRSAEAAVTTTGANRTITVTHPAGPNVTGATWNCYVATTAGGPYWQQSTGNGFAANLAIAATPPTTGTQAPGVDYSQQAAAQVVVDNATIAATTAAAGSNVVTFTGYTPTAADVGNVFHATGGTNIRVGWYEIVAWTATTWTVTGGGNLTTATGAGGALAGNMGGAFATPGGLGAALASDGVANQVAYIKYNASAYSSGSTANAPGGRLSTSLTYFITGYDTTRGRTNVDANRPVIDAGAASMTVVSTGTNTSTLRQVTVTNSAARASVTGFAVNGTGEFLKADGCTTGISNSGGNPGLLRDCWVNNAGQDGFASQGNCVRCVVTGFGRNGFATNNNNSFYLRCVAKGGTGATGGAGFGGGGIVLFDCVSRDNAGAATDGFFSFIEASNCLSYHNGRYDYNPNSALGCTRIANCAGGGSGSGVLATTNLPGYFASNVTTLTADPHTNAPGGDLSLNDTAGGGASCRAAGLPGSTTATRLYGLSTGAYPDLGPAQHADPAAVAYFAY